MLSRSSGVSSTNGAQTPSMAARPRNQPVRSTADHFSSHRVCVLKSAAPAGAAAATNEGALANFFNSLLTRKSGGPTTPSAVGTPVGQKPSKSFCSFSPDRASREI